MKEVANRPENVRAHRKAQIDRLANNPELHPLRLLAKRPRAQGGRVVLSYPQEVLTKMVEECSRGYLLECEYPVERIDGRRFYYLDVALPELKIDFEYDGQLHKHLCAKDAARDKYLISIGWSVVRFSHREFSDRGIVLNRIKETINAVRTN